MVDPTGEVGVPGLVAGMIIGGGAYAVGQVLSGNPITASGLLLYTLAGGVSGASGMYIYAGVAKLGASSVSTLLLNGAANAAVNVALNVPIQVAQNAQAGKCLATDLDVTALRAAYWGFGGGVLGAVAGGISQSAAIAGQQYANRVGNTLLPKGPLFAGSAGPVGSAVAGSVNALGFTIGNTVQSTPSLFDLASVFRIP